VDLEHSGEVRSLAHFQFEFGKTNVLIYSLLGYTAWDYPNGWIIAFNRAELQPRWGAWRPVLLAMAVVGVAVYVLTSWIALAIIYFGPVWLLGFFINRDLSLPASWKLAGAALMPGAFVMLAALLLYGLGLLDLVQMSFALVVHLVVGWVYLGVSPCFTPRIGEAKPGSNPFTSAPK
jgi:hypothetical protein